MRVSKRCYTYEGVAGGLARGSADSVVRALKIYGVKESQMEPISFGLEKPRALGHDESAWSKNRRIDLAYPAK